ncbi:MAG: HIT domain-containing protein [Acidimicrobiales bacterium]|nr:HIT domain-containing protein [Acidimicrobiales bacterium]
MWAGWRSEYIEDVTSRPPDGQCVFCAILGSGRSDEQNHVLWRSELAVAILNAYPYTNGHLMVLPLRHVAGPEDLTVEESRAVWQGMAEAIGALRAAYAPDGMNVGANLGTAAGAGIPGHFHLHVLPRWSGDTNFMTSVAETRVLPEALGRSAEKLRAAWP